MGSTQSSLNPADAIIYCAFLPDEIILMVAEYLDRQNDVYSLFLTNRHLSCLLTPSLYTFASQDHADKGMNALQWAANKGYISLAKTLLENGFDVNSSFPISRHSPPSLYHFTPLQHAIRFSSVELVTLILDHGGKIDEQADRGYTAVHTAVETLINSEIPFRDGTSPFSEDAWNRKAQEAPGVLRLLLERKPNLSILSSRGQSPLMQGVCHGSPNAIQMLLEYGANPLIKDIRHVTPLDELRCRIKRTLRAAASARAREMGEGTFWGASGCHMTW